jgi:hypothetical protein
MGKGSEGSDGDEFPFDENNGSGDDFDFDAMNEEEYEFEYENDSDDIVEDVEVQISNCYYTSKGISF